MNTNSLMAGLTLATALAGTVAAQEWPNQPIQLIVPFPAGSATDTIARIIAPGLSESLGQPVVVENQPGASGSIGAQAVSQADPDGYVIGLGTASTLAVAPALNPNLPYDPLTDFAPIGLISTAPYVLAAAPAIEAADVAELVAMARENPGSIRYASAGPASLAHLAGALFASMADVEITHIPYTTSAQAVIDLLASRVDIQFGTIPPVLPHVQAGTLKALAVTGTERSELFPDVPTLEELGYEGYNVGLWMALVAPAETPSETVAELNAALQAALQDPATATALEEQGQEVLGGAPEALSTQIGSEIEVWRATGEEAGITAE